MTLISLSFSGLADEKAVDEILVLSGIDNPRGCPIWLLNFFNPGDLQDGECNRLQISRWLIKMFKQPSLFNSNAVMLMPNLSSDKLTRVLSLNWTNIVTVPATTMNWSIVFPRRWTSTEFRKTQISIPRKLMYRKFKKLPVSHNHFFHPLTPMSDQDRISPYNINTISTRWVMRIKKNINLGVIS